MKRRYKQTGRMIVACLFTLTICVLSYSEQGRCQEEGQPISGVDWVADVSSNGESFLIDEYRYQVTSTTLYYTQDGTLTSPERFVAGLLVEFYADEQGQLLSLREEFDFEGEYALKRSGQTATSVAQDIESRRKKQKETKNTGLRLEGGVWKN